MKSWEKEDQLRHSHARSQTKSQDQTQAVNDANFQATNSFSSDKFISKRQNETDQIEEIIEVEEWNYKMEE